MLEKLSRQRGAESPPPGLGLVKKRDGEIVAFDQERITGAVLKALRATGESSSPEEAARRVSEKVVSQPGRFNGRPPTVEQIQNLVELVLIEEGWVKTSKAYIIYRNDRAVIREKRKLVSSEARERARNNQRYFQSSYEEFIYFRSYARWLEEEGRREVWEETVDRYVAFMRSKLGSLLSEEEYQELRLAILDQKVMPSMRLLWSAGEAARRDNTVAYNCAFIVIATPEDFAEVLYLSMCGVGVGFSVESQNVQLLSLVQPQCGGEKPERYVVEDNKQGWCRALLVGLRAWFEGRDVVFDYAQIRPAGARLKTMGGRSAGPEPLRQMLQFVRAKVLARQNKRLRSIDVHDIVCKIGECVVMGGVRRTALISLSDLDDEEMRAAKTGHFFLREPQRQMANNSVAYNEKPTDAEFLGEWLSLVRSGTGERGIFNRGGVIKQIPRRRRRRFSRHQNDCGTNPCGEIILRNKQFCNLTEVVMRPGDTEEALIQKIRLAAILGSFQATLTNFEYLSQEWKENCEEERLLGVSFTGYWDCLVARQSATLQKLKREAVRVNKEYAERFGVNRAAAVTCVKPSGTVSQLVNASSGLHPRHSHHYLRRIRISATDPLLQMLRDQKFPYIYPEVGQTVDSATTFVLEFPIKAPEGAVTKDDLTAIEQLEHWKLAKRSYTEHNPSATILVQPDEWLEVGWWVRRNWEAVGGLTFLPDGGHIYQLAPYEPIDEERYHQMIAYMPEIDFSLLMAYEREDQTTGNGEMACAGGACEIA